MGDAQNSSSCVSCVGCGLRIRDRFLLRVSPDLEWHARCLRCAECRRALDGSCFIRDGQTFCKQHCSSSKCAKCHKAFLSEEYVMRARASVYHVQCFRCEDCSRALLPGDEYVLQDGHLLCADHRQLVNTLMATSDDTQKQTADPSGSRAERSERSARVRTVLSEAQLHTLQTCYSANPRPDALMKETLVEMTGLSARVIRVWFQNKRCKDKKRGAMMRNTQKQTEGCLKGSEEPLLLTGPEEPWKLLTDFILQKDAEHRSYQQLLSSSKAGSEAELTDISE